MRVAYLTSRFPYPPIGGERLRAYYFLRHLARSHEVTLYAIGSPLPGTVNSNAPELSGLERKRFRISPMGYVWNALKGLVSDLPLQAKLYDSRNLRRALSRDVERGAIDLLFVHLVRMAEFARPFSHLPRILDMTDSIHLNYARMPRKMWSPLWLATRLDYRRLARYEAEAPTWFDKVLISSPVDLAWIQERTERTNFVLVPEGVELSAFPMTEHFDDAKQIIFFGKLDTMPNADAAVYFGREIFPLVKLSVPDARFVVVGWNPPREVRSLARLPGITIRANVQDVRNELTQSALSVAPMRFGAGIQNKILESLALGVPVVASQEAVLPFGHTECEAILVGRTPEDFARQVSRVLGDSAFRESLRRNGRALMESRYGWEQVLAPVDEIIGAFSKYKLCAERHTQSGS